MNPPRELFRIADSNPRYEELVVAVDTAVSNSNIHIVRFFSGKDLLYSRNVVRFVPGERIQKYFITIVNDSFYSDRGGRLVVFLGEQSVPLDIVRQGSLWIAETNGKRVRKITVEVRRFGGIPVGVDDDVPIEVSKIRINDDD
ncbi:MAG: hypothetical protein A2070_13010 [Bdellovibrionales bacterium GWC1_52_8]|nr:MAG: hypothetical protein A2070_13010 [Bdellovibrionales bacterium GWC1_52_8]